MSDAPARLLCARDLQRIFGVSARTVANWVARKRLNYFRIGGVVRFDAGQVLAFIAANTVNARRCRPVRFSETETLKQVHALLAALKDNFEFQPTKQANETNQHTRS